jgi:hypothetical protein
MDDPTVIVAIAGIAGTVLAAVLSPFVSARMSRKSARLDRLTTERIVTYADLLRATARLADNAMNWSSIPLADFKETDDEEMSRIIARARVVASKHVYERLRTLTADVHEFNRKLYMARLYHRRIEDSDSAELHGEAAQQRMELGGIADRIVAMHKDLESTVRKELRG